MSYAVMQTGPLAPSAEQLQQAFHLVPGLTAMDAKVMGKDACGVLAKGLELEQASAMQSALAALGVETEAVEEVVLTELPPGRQLTRVNFTPEALHIENLIGSATAVAWSEVAVIAAGRVRLTEFQRTLAPKLVTSGGRDYMPHVVMKSVTTEEQHDHWLLEIITHGAAFRGHAVADQPETMLLFQCLGERRGRNPVSNLSLFVQDLAQYAPAALLNHGAYCMKEAGDPTFFYPSKTSFYREITWMLWMIASGRIEV